MKRMLTAFGMSAALGITSAVAETQDEDTRWVVGSLQRGGAEEPVASFLTRDYAWVAFQATCDREAHELVIDYVVPESVGSEGTVPPGDAISIGYMRAEGERWLALATTFEQG